MINVITPTTTTILLPYLPQHMELPDNDALTQISFNAFKAFNVFNVLIQTMDNHFYKSTELNVWCWSQTNSMHFVVKIIS